MRSKLLSAMVAASLALPLAAAAADNVTYSYADLAYVTTDIDGVNEELDGFALRGSFEVTDQAFLFGTYTDQSCRVRRRRRRLHELHARRRLRVVAVRHAPISTASSAT